MGKQVSQASMKISKNEKNQLSSLIKVLRPKVYITDNSGFKRLVQELTGYGRIIPSPPPSTVVGNAAVVNVEAHGEPESSVETISFDASVDHSFEFCNQSVPCTEELNQPYNREEPEPESSTETSFDASTDSFKFCNQLVPFTEEPNQPYNHGEPENSMETSFDASTDSFKFCNLLVPFTEEPNQPYTHGEPESSMETSFDASVDSFEFCNQLVPFTQELNQPCNHGEPESSMKTSFDASANSFEFCNQLDPFTEELNQPYSQLHFDDVTSDHLSVKQADMFTGQDFESLLLDIEQYPFSSSYSQIHQPEEVSIYDYELSGLW